MEDGDELLVVDIGASQLRSATEYALHSHMADRLRRAGTTVTWLAPTTSETESRKAALRSLRAARLVFPGCDLAIVRNQRDGRFESVLDPVAAQVEAEIAADFADIAVLTLPRISPLAFLPIENAGIAPFDARNLDVETISRLSGNPEDIAAMTKDMVQSWVDAIEEAWSPQLRFLGPAPAADHQDCAAT